MKRYILLAILLCSFKAYSQDSGWVFSVYATPSYSFRTLKPAKTSLIDSNNAKDVADIKFDLGIRLGYNISKRLKISFGVAYASKGYSTNFDLDTSFRPNKAKKYTPAIQADRYNFIEIPLYLTYKIVDNDFKLGIVAGVSNSFLIKHQTDIPVYNDPDIEIKTLSDTSNIGAYHVSLLLGLEVGYKVSEHINLFAQPNYRYSFTNFMPLSLIPHNPYPNATGNLYNIGVTFGMDYKF